MDENLLRKLRALRAKAEDASVGEAEAALYAAKVQELLATYGLSMQDIPESEREDHFVEERWDLMYADPWRWILTSASAQLYFCDCFEHQWDDQKGKIRKGHTFVGRPHNVVTAREMAQYLVDATLRLARNYAAEHENEYSSRRAAQIGFERGCGVRLAQRLRELYREKARPQEQTSSGLPALYRTELELARQFMHQQHPGMREQSVSSSGNYHSRAGRRAADGVSLSPQVGTQSGRNLLR